MLAASAEACGEPWDTAVEDRESSCPALRTVDCLEKPWGVHGRSKDCPWAPYLPFRRGALGIAAYWYMASLTELKQVLCYAARGMIDIVSLDG